MQGATGGSGRDRLSGTDTAFSHLWSTPVVYTCGVSVLQGLRRTKEVPDGL